MEDRNKFVEDLKIDPGQLDVEAARQGELFFEYAERAAEARAEMERARLDMDALQARLESKIRKDPEGYGVPKGTEGAIKSAVLVRKEYVEAQKHYLDAKAESLMLDKAVDALEQKKRMIEVLVTLHGQSYFAGPSVPRNLVSAYREAQAKREDRVVARQKKTLRKKG